jgi:ribosomal protein S12 methylthiotransferase
MPSPSSSLPILGEQTQPRSPNLALEPPVVAFVSLGCAKNLVDSEKMLGQLAESGALITGDEAAADTVVVNTCGFLESSRTEALDIIHELAERKRAGQLKRIVVAGCLVQRDGEKLRDAAPDIDALVGVNNRDDVVRAVWRLDRDAATDHYLGDYHPQPDNPNAWTDQGRLRLTPQHYAYVRVSEGCNQKCTFCTIPSIRGPMHSKTPDQLIAECQELIHDGVSELILIGQDTTSYGHDIGYDKGLAGLLRELNAACDGARWIRLMYVYPSIFTDEMIAAIAESDRIVKYIDIPLQHINDRVLRTMARRVTRRQTETLLEKLRTRIPGVAIRTTFIVGFPSETDAEFEELRQFVADFGFDAAGAFKYSLEPETPAARVKHRVPDALIDQRHEALMLTQQQVAFTKARQQVGQEFDVTIDELTTTTDNQPLAIARHARQAPEVDPVCLLRDPPDAPPGTLLHARCTTTHDYDLVVEPTR